MTSESETKNDTRDEAGGGGDGGDGGDGGPPMSPGVAIRRGGRLQIAVAVGAAILSVASAVAAILGQEIQYRQMRAIETIAHRCSR